MWFDQKTMVMRVIKRCWWGWWRQWGLSKDQFDQKMIRDGWRYQKGWFFGKVPKGGGGSFSIPKGAGAFHSYLAIHGKIMAKNGNFFMEFWPIFDIFHGLLPYLCSKRYEVGFHKQATHRRRGDEPFFYSGVDRSWLGMAQKWSILDQKWPNMAGLSTLQSGPKGS